MSSGDAVHTVAVFVMDDNATWLARRPQDLEPALLAEVIELTPREIDVLKLMAQGADNQTIATQLAITPKTVRNYVSRIYSKLGMDTRAQAIVLAREGGGSSFQLVSYFLHHS